MSIISSICVALLCLVQLIWAQPGNYSRDEKTAVVIASCSGEVNETMYKSLEKAVLMARQSSHAVLIVKIDTFGGRVDAAFKISDLLAGQNDILTVAYVETKAISAGSLIALSCGKLYMKRQTTIGDCAPIITLPSGAPQMLGEKFQSPIRAKFRALAEQNGYPVRLTEALVTRGPQIYSVATPSGPQFFDSVAWAALPDSVSKKYTDKKVIVKGDQLLTMTDEEAAAYGFSKASVSGIDEVINDLHLVNYRIVKSQKDNGGIGAMWSTMSGLEKMYWYITIPFTVLLIFMLGLTFLGLGETSADHDISHDVNHVEAAFKLFTIRNFVVFFALFGWTGIAMIRSGMGRFATISVSCLSGLIMMFLVSLIFYFISRMTSSGNMDIKAVEGQEGVVYIPIPEHKSGFGKVNVLSQGRKLELNAMTDGARIETGASVRILHVNENEFLVVERS